MIIVRKGNNIAMLYLYMLSWWAWGQTCMPVRVVLVSSQQGIICITFLAHHPAIIIHKVIQNACGSETSEIHQPLDYHSCPTKGNKTRLGCLHS